MPPITAILNTYNDERRLSRVLQTLYPCDEILIVDHGSTDRTLCIARDYAASIPHTVVTPPAHHQLQLARHDWILCLLPSEALTEGLEASLFEWKMRASSDLNNIVAGAVVVREETVAGWSSLPPSTRLIPRTWTSWEGLLPRNHSQALTLTGDLLRFRLP